MAERNDLRGYECDECGYVWLRVEGVTPDRCRNPKCRTRKWNRKAASGDKVAAINNPEPQSRDAAPRVPPAAHHATCKCSLCLNVEFNRQMRERLAQKTAAP